jgi:cytochrome c oxidase assembly protein subunit 15
MVLSSLERGAIGAASLALIVASALWVGRSRERFRALVTATLALTFVLVVLGAYVRLSDAGLGCPDWPGCYGDLSPHHAADQIRAAEAAMPSGPVSMAKAWKEMVHRYLAMVVGSLVAGILVAAWRRHREPEAGAGLATGLAALVIFQALLGAWTVTMLLKPAIVTSHLLGGLAVLGLLAWLRLKQGGGPGDGIIPGAGLRRLSAAAFAILLAQVTLGGWTSTNYAALACTDFPLCRGAWVPEMNLRDAFHVIRELGMSAEGALLPMEALVGIHWMHRVGAVVATVALGWLAHALAKAPGGRTLGRGLATLLALQVVLGIANVLASLPLAVAVAHNAGAALLVAWLVTINYRVNTAATLR